MSTFAERKKKLRVGGIWHDSRDNKVEIKRIYDGKVWFDILELPDNQPQKLPDGVARIMPMEDRVESMRIDVFIAKATGFDCMSEYGRPKTKNY